MNPISKHLQSIRQADVLLRALAERGDDEAANARVFSGLSIQNGICTSTSVCASFDAALSGSALHPNKAIVSQHKPLKAEQSHHGSAGKVKLFAHAVSSCAGTQHQEPSTYFSLSPDHGEYLVSTLSVL